MGHEQIRTPSELVNAVHAATRPKVKAKPKATAPAKTTPTPVPADRHGSATTPGGGFSWGPGQPSNHSISLQQHQLDTTPLSAPQTYPQAVAGANAAGDLQYGPQIAANQSVISSLPTWMQDYLTSTANLGASAHAAAAPGLANAAGAVTNMAAVAPGIDPSSPEYAKAQQAGQGRAALAQVGSDTLQSQDKATQDYFAGLQELAKRMEPQQLAALIQHGGQLQAQRGAAVTSYLDTARTNATNADIARGTLDLNTNKAVATATQAASNAAQTASDKAAGRAVTKRGQDLTRQTAEDKIAAAKTKAGATAKKQKAAHLESIHAATGKVVNNVTDIISQWAKGGTTVDNVPIKGAPLNVLTGTAPTEKKQRAMTREELRAAMDKKFGPQMVDIALAVRDHKQLTGAQVNYLHNLDKDFRVPASWLPRATAPTEKVAAHGGTS